MIHRYGLDPAVVEDLGAFAFLVGQLGAENGRVLDVGFPGDWFERALAHVNALPNDLDRNRAARHLRNLRTDASKLSRTGALFYETQPWLTNALAAATHFRALICDDGSPIPPAAPKNVTAVSSVLSGSRLWEAPRTAKFPATVKDTMEVVRPVLATGRRILIMDPYFSLRRRYHLDFVAALSTAMARGGCLEVHARYKDDEREHVSTEAWVRLCNQHLSPLSTRHEVEIVVARWSPREQGSHVHKRWIISERAGLELDRGLFKKDRSYNECTLMGRERIS